MKYETKANSSRSIVCYGILVPPLSVREWKPDDCCWYFMTPVFSTTPVTISAIVTNILMNTVQHFIKRKWVIWPVCQCLSFIKTSEIWVHQWGDNSLSAEAPSGARLLAGNPTPEWSERSDDGAGHCSLGLQSSYTVKITGFCIGLNFALSSYRL